MFGSIGFVDLASGASTIAPVPESWRRRYLGGRGVNIRLLARGPVPGMCAPSSLQEWMSLQPLLFGVGLLAGLPCPSPSRLNITGPSPETGLLADSNIGGAFAPALRRAGYDHLALLGQAPEPCVLLAESGRLVLEPAGTLWGLDTLEAIKELERRYGPDSQSLVIGRAGENQVRFACVRHGLKSAAGRGGLGCLMGMKRVKAVVARGGGRPEACDDAGLRACSEEQHKRILATRTREVLHAYGTIFLFDLHNYVGIVRTLNGRLNRFIEGRAMRTKAFARYFTGRRPCQGCRIACRHVYQVEDAQGRIVENEGPEYGMVGNFGPVLGIADAKALLLLNHQLNDLGLDAASAGNIIAWAMELFDKGLLTTADTDGLELRWGDAAIVARLLEDIAACRGFGALLAKGAREAAAAIGKGAAEHLIWVKNSPQSDSVDVRAYKGFALGVATATRGGDHLRSRPTMEALHLPAEQLRAMYGADISPDPTSYQGKARMVWQSEREYALADALGLCRFAQRFNSPDLLAPEDLRNLAELASGLRWSPEEFLDIGERITCLDRCYLAARGVTRKDDSLPPRYFEPMPEGGYAGECIDPRRFAAMLDEYYDLHGWERATGRPLPETLERLDIEPE